MALGESRFGWGKFRPWSLQWLNTPKWLLVFLSLTNLTMQMVVSGTYSVSISTIEKRFGLSSSSTGLITSMYDVASLLVIASVSYYGGRQSKARWLGAGLLTIALGSFIFLLPHFIIGPYQPGKEHSRFPPLCQLNATNSFQSLCDSSSTDSHWYLTAIFCIGMLVIGFGSSPIYVLGIAYLDESVKKKVSALYLGIFSSAAILGAAIGFALGGFLLSINVDIGEETSLTPSDSRWIGNWWLAFVILVFTSLLLFPAISGFHGVFPGAPIDHDEQNQKDKVDDESVAVTVNRLQHTSVKGLLAATKTLFTFPSYLLISLGASLDTFEIAASTAFLPKIMQVLYNISPAKVSFLYGVAVIIPVFFGQLFGSYMVKKLKLGAKGALKATCIITAISVLVTFCYIFTNCDNPEILGVTKDFENSTFQTVNDCNVPCDCERWPYYPVCDGNTSLWSPCHARCASYSKSTKEFHGCLCTVSKGSVVKPGKCPYDCGFKLAIFLLVIASFGFLTFLTQTPIVIAVLRSVPHHLNAYAVGWSVKLSRILGSIPGPIIYGKLIDTACIQWQQTCDGKGSCQEYNHWKLVLITTSVMVILKIITLVSFLIAWKLLKGGLNGVPSTSTTKLKTDTCNDTSLSMQQNGEKCTSF